MYNINQRFIKVIFNLFLFLGILLNIIYFSNKAMLISLPPLVIGLFFFLLISLNNRKMLKQNSIIFFILTIFMLLKLFYYQMNNFSIVNDYIILISNLGYSQYLIFQNNQYKLLEVIYYIVTGYLIYWIITNGDLGQIANFSSQNGVNFIYLLCSIMVITTSYYLKEKIILYPAILSFLISLYSLGRSGIIASLILLAGLILIKYSHRFNHIGKTFLSFIIVILILSFYETIMDFFSNVITKFGQKDTFIEGNARFKIWNEYLNSLNIQKLVFGSNVNTDSYYGFSNLHNSFLGFHETFGVLAIVFFSVIIYALICALINRNYLYFVLLFVIVIRAMADTIILIGRYDFILILLLYLIIFICNNKLDYVGKIRKHETNTSPQ